MISSQSSPGVQDRETNGKGQIRQEVKEQSSKEVKDQNSKDQAAKVRGKSKAKAKVVAKKVKQCKPPKASQDEGVLSLLAATYAASMANSGDIAIGIGGILLVMFAFYRFRLGVAEIGWLLLLGAPCIYFVLTSLRHH